MNERIRQLKEQARDFYLLQEDLDCSTKELHKLVDAKFAELIVRECLDSCGRANEIRNFLPPTQELVVLSCIREIETTFRS